MPEKERLRRRLNSEKAAALFLVLAILLVVVILGEVVLNIMQRQSRFTHHKTSRIKAYYAAQAGMNYALEMLKTGTWTADAAIKYACINGCVDSVSPAYTVADSDIPYSIQIRINPRNQALSNTVTQLDIKTKYTYTP